MSSGSTVGVIAAYSNLITLKKTFQSGFFYYLKNANDFKMFVVVDI